jgi:hypothetical protein
LIPKANPVLRYCAGLLIPSVITLISTVAACVNDATQMATFSPALDEALKALTTFFAGVPDVSRTLLPYGSVLPIDLLVGAAALGVILPTLALLLDTSRSPPSPLHVQTIPIVLGLATSAPAPFKEVTEKLDATVRETLQAAVRQALAGRQQLSAQSSAKPQISLKAF